MMLQFGIISNIEYCFHLLPRFSFEFLRFGKDLFWKYQLLMAWCCKV